MSPLLYEIKLEDLVEDTLFQSLTENLDFVELFINKYTAWLWIVLGITKFDIDEMLEQQSQIHKIKDQKFYI